jgi:hypothetical protein
VTYGGDSYEEARAVEETTDGGFIAAGWTRSYGAGEDGYVVKTDADGQVEWQENYGQSRLDRFYSVVPTVDGGYIMAGRSRSFSDHDRAYLVKTDALGNVVWERSYGERPATGARNIKETSDGAFIVAGWTGRIRHGKSVDLLLFKIDREGEIIWWRETRHKDRKGAHEVAETPDGGFVVAGLAGKNRTRDGWLLKTDKDGKPEWWRRDGTRNGPDEWHGLVVVDDGIVVSGGTFRNGGMRTWVMKTDFEGHTQWSRWFRQFSYSWHIDQTNDGGFALTGNARPHNSPNKSFDSFVLKLDAQGRREFGFHVGGPFTDNGKYIISSSDGDLLMVGYYGHEEGQRPTSETQYAWNRDFWFVKLDLEL